MPQINGGSCYSYQSSLHFNINYLKVWGFILGFQYLFAITFLELQIRIKVLMLTSFSSSNLLWEHRIYAWVSIFFQAVFNYWFLFQSLPDVGTDIRNPIVITVWLMVYLSSSFSRCQENYQDAAVKTEKKSGTFIIIINIRSLSGLNIS